MPRGVKATESSAFFAELLKKYLGFTPAPDKGYLVKGRLTPVLHKYRIDTVDDLIKKLRESAAPDLLNDVLDAMTIGETYFFRDDSSFKDFHQTILPTLLKAAGDRKNLRFWSAASSTGQEAYSLAMSLRDAPGYGKEWRAEILGTDISGAAIEKASSATYTHFDLQRGISDALRKRYFTQVGDDAWQLSHDIRSMVTFRKMNLLEPLDSGPLFDVILCRNVLIYFDKPTKEQVLNNLCQRLVPHGLLILARTDAITGLKHKLHQVAGLTNVFSVNAPTK